MQKKRMNMWKDLNIATLPRLSKFPFQVQSLGYTHGEIWSDRVAHYENLEVCIRRYSREAAAAECINGTLYQTKFPNVILKLPGSLHQMTVTHPRDVVHFTYSGKQANALLQILPVPEKPVWEVDLGSLENRIITELMDLMEKSHDYGVTDRIDLLAFELLELLVFSCSKSHMRPDYHETRIRSVASYFQLHYQEEIDIVRLAARHGMSRSTFLRHWRKLFRITPGQYLLELKLQEACRLLRGKKNLPIGDITLRLGFKGPAYFCALFKKKFGVTPLQFRHLANTEHAPMRENTIQFASRS